jgi:hypothetical protein
LHSGGHSAAEEPAGTADPRESATELFATPDGAAPTLAEVADAVEELVAGDALVQAFESAPEPPLHAPEPPPQTPSEQVEPVPHAAGTEDVLGDLESWLNTLHDKPTE